MQILILKFSRRLYFKAIEEDVFSRAATVAFYFSFAFFPLLLFLISLFGLILDNAADLRTELFSFLSQIMPSAAYQLVQKTVFEVIVGSSGTTLTVGLLIFLWSASAGFDNLRIALNGVYGLKETRSRVRLYLVMPLLTICLCVLLSIALGLIFYGTSILTWGLPGLPVLASKLLGWAIILVAMLIVFVVIYRLLPDHKEKKIIWVIPGSIVGIILWLLLSGGFRLYLEFFDTYSSMYGSLGAMIILMLWLYLTALVILTGGIINAICDEFANQEKTAS